jgi:hypothetical protein
VQDMSDKQLIDRGDRLSREIRKILFSRADSRPLSECDQLQREFEEITAELARRRDAVKTDTTVINVSKDT